MSFGQEMKDFANGFKTVKDAQETEARKDYYRQLTKKSEDGDKETVDDNDNIDAMDSSGKSYDELPHPHKRSAVPATPAAVASSPTAATQAVGNLPLTTYNAANGGGDPLAVASPAINDGYSRGGLVRGYADGGAVPDDDQAPPAPAPAPAPAQALNIAPPAPAATPPPAPAAPAQQALPVGGQPQAAPADQGSDKGIIGDALHAGLMALKGVFGLDQQSSAVGPDPRKAAGQKAFMSGAGGGTPEDVKAVDQAIDPQQQLTSAERSLHRMETGYRYFMEKGEPEKAANYAAMIIQYSAGQAKKLGSAALDDLQNGDIKGAAEKLAQAGDVIPNGQHVEPPKMNPDGTVSTTQVDTKTGKPIADHTLTGQQLFQMALGLKNGNGYYQTIMQAAGSAKGYAAPTSDAYNNAQLGLAGLNPDGSPKTPGAAPAAQPQGQTQPQAPQQQAPAAAQPQSPAQPATPAQSPAPAQLASDANAYTTMMRGGESAGNPNAQNGQSVGLYQIQPAAWKDATGHDPIVNGVDERLDPAKNAAVFQKLTQQNAAIFKQKWARDPSPLELATMHQQGAAGGMALMQAARVMPNTPAVQLVGDPSKLTRNGIPANATAKQAVQIIQSHYAKFLPAGGAPGPSESGRAVTIGSPPADSMDVRDALDEDKVDKPEAPKMPSAPEVVHALPKDMDGMSPAEKVAYIKQVGAQNLNNQKQFQDAMTQYRSQAAAAKPAKAGANPLNVPLKDQNDVLSNLKNARADIEGDKSELFNSLGPEEKGAADDVAYGFLTHNQITPHQAYRLTSILLSGVKPDLNKPGNAISQQGFTAYKMPSNPDLVRIVGTGGTKYVLPMDTYQDVMKLRKKAIDGASKLPTDDGGAAHRAYAAKTAKIVGRGIAGTVAGAIPATADAMAPLADRVNSALSHPVLAAKAVAKKGIAAVNSAYQSSSPMPAEYRNRQSP